ncbi:MAG: hypothetical protein OQJ96_13495 [Flavobacteriales bacterium]|nr:hypothetical protein [Flavobacteriales bacterium]MCW8912889.1 hypothetical protein [Flavobacteriales bacterium]MCW8937238.1 hypothetical protein [Flavobacteriales bacterium]MCW8940091.1 hypothetical protein [Flavobacteriales bacterium]MCW8967801.1 hypothetical protein [Flavobacteriales bacterium]
MNEKKLLKENLNNANTQTYGDQVFDKLLAERIKLVIERAPMEKLMDATAEIARYELGAFEGAPIEYNLKSLPIVDALIDKYRERFRRTEDDSMLAAVWFGAFIGKVLVNEFNGKWQQIPDSEWIANFRFGKIVIGSNLMISPTVTILKSIDDDSYRVEDFVRSLQVLVNSKDLQEFIISQNNNN